jgi:hypothetical protein
MPSKGRVVDPDSGGIKIPEAVKRRTEERIRRYAKGHFAGRYTRLDIRYPRHAAEAQEAARR